MELLRRLGDGTIAIDPRADSKRQEKSRAACQTIYAACLGQSAFVKRSKPATRGLPGCVSQGDLEEFFGVIDLVRRQMAYAWLKKSSDARYREHARNLVEYALARGLAPEELTYELVGGWCVAYALVGNQPTGLWAILAAFRYVANDLGWTYTAAAEKRVRGLVRSLVSKTPITSPNYAFPWLAEMSTRFARVSTAAPGGMTLGSLRVLASLELSRATGMRGGTRFSSKRGEIRIMKSSLQWYGIGDDRGVTVNVPPGKSGPGRQVSLQFDPLNEWAPYSVLRKWFDRSGMAAQAMNAPFIPAFGAGGAIDWSAEMPRTTFVQLMRLAGKAIGLSDSYLARLRGHSLRAGCATDLILRGVPIWQVKIIGGWKSDAVLMYARITAAQMAQWSAIDVAHSGLLSRATYSGSTLPPFIARGHGPV